MKFEEKDVVTVLAETVGMRGYHYTLRHELTGIVVVGPADAYKLQAYDAAVSILKINVNAYYTAAKYCAYCGAEGHEAKDCSWAAPGIERVKRNPTMSDLIANGYVAVLDPNPMVFNKRNLNEAYGKIGSDQFIEAYSAMVCDRETRKAEQWLEQQPDHSAISKGLVLDQVWELLNKHTVCAGGDGTRYIDFDALRLDICKRYNVRPY